MRLCDIRSPDILEQIPFTTGAELAEHCEDYLCVRSEELIHVVTSSGTKGLRKKIWLTYDDLNHQARMIGTHLCRLGGVSRVGVMFLVGGLWSITTLPIRCLTLG